MQNNEMLNNKGLKTKEKKRIFFLQKLCIFPISNFQRILFYYFQMYDYEIRRKDYLLH